MKDEQTSSSSRKRRASSLSVHTESFCSDEDLEPVEITKRVRTRADVVNDAEESSRTPHSLSEYDTDDEPSQELTIATTSLDQDSCGSPNSAFPSPSPSPIVSSTEPHQNFSSYFDSALTGRTLHSSNTPRPIRNLSSILSTFDTLPQATQSYLLFQLLRRSSTTTLQFVNALVIPALKRDFLASLPFELSLHILRYLDVVTLCRAAQVSKKWRMVVDADATIWRRNIERDGFKFTLSEVRQVVARQAATRAARKQKMIVLSDHRDSSAIATMDVDDPEESRLLRKVIAESDHICVNNTDDAALASQGTPTSSSSMPGTYASAPLEPSTPHPYKEIYRKHFIIRQNWKRDRATHISFQGHANNVVTCLQYDDDKIISGSDDRCINVYDTNTGKLRKTMSDHEGGVWALQYVGNTLVSGSTDRTVRVWDIERGTSTHVFPGHTSTVRCLQIVMPEMIDGRLQPSRPLIVTGSRDSTLRVWRLPDPVHDEPYLTHSPNNPWFMHTLAGHTQSVRAIAARGNLLVSGSYDYTMRLWNIETGRLIHLMEGHTQRVYSVVLDIDNRRCMSGSMDSTVRIWSLDDGSCLNVLEGHSILVGLLHLTPNHLVSAAADSTLRIWSTETGICEHVLSGHQAAITCFQHDENKVVSGSEGGLKLWDINTGQLVRDLITNVTGVWRVAFDERRCVAAVNRNNVTWFEVLDYGVQGFEDDTEIM
ncbi:WD40-repeat-containing domain protein [Umbelopsis sp. AD052]|nr:WD40-repeat-containing domain protein [Umbelopsis sp. AD052]